MRRTEDEPGDLAALTTQITESDNYGSRLTAAGKIAFLGQKNPQVRGWILEYLGNTHISPENYRPLFQLPLAFLKDPTAEELHVVERYWNENYAHGLIVTCSVIAAAAPSLTEDERKDYASRAKTLYQKLHDGNSKGPLVELVGKLQEAAEEDWYCSILVNSANSLSWFNPEIGHAYQLAVQYNPHKAAQALTESMQVTGLDPSHKAWQIEAILPLIAELDTAEELKEVVKCVTDFDGMDMEDWEDSLIKNDLIPAIVEEKEHVIELLEKLAAGGIDASDLLAVLGKYGLAP